MYSIRLFSFAVIILFQFSAYKAENGYERSPLIESNVILENDARICNGASVHSGAVIGANTKIYSGVDISANTILARDCYVIEYPTTSLLLQLLIFDQAEHDLLVSLVRKNFDEFNKAYRDICEKFINKAYASCTQRTPIIHIEIVTAFMAYLVKFSGQTERFLYLSIAQQFQNSSQFFQGAKFMDTFNKMLLERHFDGSNPSKDIVSMITVRRIQPVLVYFYDYLSRAYEKYRRQSSDTLCNTISNLYEKKFEIVTPRMISRLLKKESYE